MKTCNRCGETKPLEAFDRKKSNSDGRRGACKECRWAQRKKACDKWVQKNAAHIRDYAEKLRQKRLLARPEPACLNGHTGDVFFWSNDRWNCHVCSLEASRIRRLKRERELRVATEATRLEKVYGRPFSNVYVKLHEASQTTPVRIAIEALLAIMLGNKKTAERVYLLNRIAKQPLDKLHWTCRACGISKDDPRFFDVDHINPRRHHGGSRLQNLQILCPNCHRSKTLSEPS